MLEVIILVVVKKKVQYENVFGDGFWDRNVARASDKIFWVYIYISRTINSIRTLQFYDCTCGRISSNASIEYRRACARV